MKYFRVVAGQAAHCQPDRRPACLMARQGQRTTIEEIDHGGIAQHQCIGREESVIVTFQRREQWRLDRDRRHQPGVERAQAAAGNRAQPLPRIQQVDIVSSALELAALYAQRLAQTKRKVELAAQRLIMEAERSHQFWQLTEQTSQQSQRQANTMMLAYELGEITLAEALNARRQAYDALLLAESAKIDALATHARLQLDAHLLWSID